MVDGRYEDADRRIRELEVAVADRDAVIASLKLQLEALEQKVKALTARLSENSKNSSRPPSSDPPGKSKGKKGKSKRKRGAQPGHKGQHRELLPPERVDQIEDVFPPKCENCWKPLPEVLDSDARRHQVTEIPPLKPFVTEHREHTVACLDCGHRTQGRLDPAIACSSFGPRLSAIVGLLTGVYHVSRRKTLTLPSESQGEEYVLWYPSPRPLTSTHAPPAFLVFLLDRQRWHALRIVDTFRNEDRRPRRYLTLGSIHALDAYGLCTPSSAQTFHTPVRPPTSGERSSRMAATKSASSS